MSQRDLATRINLTQGAAWTTRPSRRCRRGARQITLEESFQLAHALDVAPVNLWVPPEVSGDISLGPNMSGKAARGSRVDSRPDAAVPRLAGVLLDGPRDRAESCGRGDDRVGEKFCDPRTSLGGGVMPATQQGEPCPAEIRRLGESLLRRDGPPAAQEPIPEPERGAQVVRENVEPLLRGEQPQEADITLGEFLEIFLERHAAVRPRTISTLRDRLGHAVRCLWRHPAQGPRAHDERDRRMAGATATCGEPATGSRSGALRQALDAAVRWERR